MDKASNTAYHLNKIKMVYQSKNKEQEELEGFCVANPGYTIGINIHRLWDDVRKDKRIKYKENVFMKRFAQTTTHEFLHRECEEIKSDLFDYREEEIIRTTLGELWDEKAKKDYRRKRPILPY